MPVGRGSESLPECLSGGAGRLCGGRCPGSSRGLCDDACGGTWRSVSGGLVGGSRGVWDRI